MNHIQTNVHPSLNPVIITGMHRSGTSLTASLIQKIGVKLGEQLLEADVFNPTGYFEDVDFLEFQRTVLKAMSPSGDFSSHTDWGWTERETLDRSLLPTYIEKAQALIQAKQQRSQIWGWKDPRTSLLLDFWHQLLPDARYFFVYRVPWDVVESILRQKGSLFCQRPDYALRVWAFYNRHILNFYRANRDRCVLVNTFTMLKHPEQIAPLLRDKLHIQVKQALSHPELESIYQDNLFHTRDWQHPLVSALEALSPESFALLSELDQVADIPSYFDCRSKPDTPLAAIPFLLHAQAIHL